jgi:hypothetical protein
MQLSWLSFFAASASAKLQCHCQPSDPCWPSTETWNQLNGSVSGNLVALRPLAAACHDPDYDEKACQAVRAQSRNSTFLADAPSKIPTAHDMNNV